MQEKHQIQDLMGVTMEKIRDMVDVQTIIGDPIVVSDTVTIIPVSKVSYGFASGGSDLPAKSTPKDLFGGGAGAGVSIQPVAFLVVQEDSVRLLQMDESDDLLGSAIRSVPGVVEQIGSPQEIYYHPVNEFGRNRSGNCGSRGEERLRLGSNPVTSCICSYQRQHRTESV